MYSMVVCGSDGETEEKNVLIELKCIRKKQTK